MKNQPKINLRKKVERERPNYYITPTRDFTQYTKDCEEKYWSKDTAFDWQQSVPDNLMQHLENLPPADLSRIALMVLPMVKASTAYYITQIRQEGLPLEEDALKAIADCITFDRIRIQMALSVQAPLKELQLAANKLKDEIEILQGERLDLQEQQRLGLVKSGNTVKQLETETEREIQTKELTELIVCINQTYEKWEQIKEKQKTASNELKMKVKSSLQTLEPQVIGDLEASLQLIEDTLSTEKMPNDPEDLSRLKDLIWKRQLLGLKDIANHALVVEQSAIAPLTMGIIHYKRHREIQEAMTTFINDEAKHSSTFRRFLVEKLQAKEFISEILIKGANRYMWLSRISPSTGFFLAVIIEAIGAASLEFFGNEKYMPDKLFCSICKTIAEQDEKRHMDLCVATYNELYRKGTSWERFRNTMALKKIMKSVYGDKTENHRLIQAFRSFGVDSKFLYQHITSRLSEQLARISLYVEPEELLRMIGRD